MDGYEKKNRKGVVAVGDGGGYDEGKLNPIKLYKYSEDRCTISVLS